MTKAARRVAPWTSLIWIFSLLGALTGPALAQVGSSDSNPALFPRPPQLTDAISFWTRVYTEVGTDGGFIHDSRYLGVVYEVVRFPQNATPRQRRRLSNRAADTYRDILERLAADPGGALTTDEARVRALWPADTTAQQFRAAAQRLRFQLGQADRFREGLIRSGRWKPYIVDVLEAHGLPTELAVLPHVESSFDPTAYSKVGAAGMWQFTRSTGLRYMQIDHIVDERRDPYLSTEAAARLLTDNYAVTQSWPLALTAYNHGLAGMRRAVERLGTSDIGVIVDDYSGRTFGFASRNFYAAFVAALDVDRNPERYFGSVAIDAAEDHLTTELPDYVDAAPLARALGVSVLELRRLNPALMDAVWAGDKYVPKGFPLRLPGTLGETLAARLESIPAAERFADQRPDVYHRVSRGETLSGIADRYRISLAALVRANGLSNRNFIRAGQRLTLPIAGDAPPPSRAEIQASYADGGQYIVRSGDSIDRISRRLGVEQTALLRANNIANRNRIYVGQILNVPSNRASSESRAVTATLAAAPGVAAAPVLTAANRPEPATRAAEPSRPIETELAGSDEAGTDDEAGTGEALVASTLVAATLDREPVTVDPDAPALDAAEAAQRLAETDGDVDLDSNVLASTQANLAADPSDYSVAGDGTIEVQAMETLGHYADWLGIRTQRLRDINGMPFGQAVVYGQRIELDFSNVDTATFEARRQDYHEGLQESFFSSYQIADIVDHVVRTGESLWILAQRRYNVPFWLLRQYNPDIDFDRVRPGTIVKFPQLRAISNDVG